jgi:hypothetical protein
VSASDRQASTAGYTEQHATPEEWDEWLMLYDNRDSVAGAYATLLSVWPADWPGWRELNESILRRWSPAGLRYIKEKALKSWPKRSNLDRARRLI